MAVLRYRAVIGTASMNRNALTEGVTRALETALQSYKPFLEKASLFLEKEGSSVAFVSNNHFICGWPMLTFDIKLIKKKRLLNSYLTVRIYVASDMLRSAQVKTDTIKYCQDNNIVIVDNLFQFCQPQVELQEEWRRQNAENEILDQIERRLKNSGGSTSTSGSLHTRYSLPSNHLIAAAQNGAHANSRANFTPQNLPLKKNSTATST